jgi:uncharacterized protein (TIRG00374 family)
MKHWKTWLGCIIGTGFLYLVFRRIDLRLLLENLKKADYVYLAPIVIIIFITMALRAIRWGYFLQPIKRIGFHSLFEGILISFMANNVLPARMGEFVRAYIIGGSERISKSASFATVVVERLFDGLTVLGLLTVVLIFVPFPPGNMPFKTGLLMGGYIAIAICVLTLAILAITKVRPGWLLDIVSLVRPFSATLANKSASGIRSFKEGLLCVESARIMVVAVLYSILIWAVFAYSIYLIGLAFGLKLSLAAVVMVLLAVCLAVMIPATPGYIGPYHAAVAYALVLYNIPLEKALSLSIVFHAINYLPITLAGFLYLGRHHLTLQKIREAGAKAAKKQ